MNKLCTFLCTSVLFFLFFFTAVSAQGVESYQATFTLVGTTAVVEETMTFTSPQQNFTWPLPEDAKAVEVSEGSLHIRHGEEGEQEIKITGNFVTLKITYLTESLVEKTKDRFFLVDLGGVTTEKIDIKVVLPEGATLKYPLSAETSLQTSVVPKTSNVTTDGKSITLQWDEKGLQQGKAIMVRYIEPPLSVSSKGILLFVLVLFLSFGIFFLYKRRIQRKKKEDTTAETRNKEEGTESQGEDSITEKFTRNLFEEERAIMKTLLKAEQHELWQKQLALMTRISAVKLSRKLRNLEAKGLIEKVPYGNTNKIRIKSPN